MGCGQAGRPKVCSGEGRAEAGWPGLGRAARWPPHSLGGGVGGRLGEWKGLGRVTAMD